MASPTRISSTPTRVPLGILNVNTPRKPQGQASKMQDTNLKTSYTTARMSPTEKSHFHSPSQPHAFPPPPTQALALQCSMSQTLHPQTPVVRKKRHHDVSEPVDAVPSKRQSKGIKIGAGLEADVVLDLAGCDEEEGRDVGCDNVEILREAAVVDSRLDDAGSAGFTQSPASSCGSGEDSMSVDNSQNTIVTMPDDVPVLVAIAIPSVVRSVMSRQELRDQAYQLRLRLQLASYKVSTDQIDTPLDRLQVRTTTETNTLPRLPRSHSPFRTSFPQQTSTSTRVRESNIPNINVQRPSSSTNEAHPGIPSSPPAHSTSKSPSKKAEKHGREECITPLPPRQIDRLGLPTKAGNGSPGWDGGSGEKDLTSSVVKGRAADGLLSLGKRQE